MKRHLTLFAALVLLAFAATGCASRKFVRAEVDTAVTEAEGRTADKVSSLTSQVEQTQSELATTRSRVDQHEGEIDELSKTAQEALERALAAGKLAEGKLLSETVLANDLVRFGFEKAELTDDAKKALDEFAQTLKAEDRGVYIEIQGHTDSTGNENYNLALGEERAEAVRRYLNKEHSLPLHRMSVISYGEAAPTYDNGDRDGRLQNRRVVLVVLI
jgi:outer membrane protein OmpA-like peptidoglycan-associated protein